MVIAQKEAAMTTQHGAGANQGNRMSDVQVRAASARPQLLSLDPRQLSLAVLAQHCAIESTHFYRGRSHDTRFAFELFRRAIVDRDDLAWEHLYMHYSPLVEG